MGQVFSKQKNGNTEGNLKTVKCMGQEGEFTIQMEIDFWALSKMERRVGEACCKQKTKAVH